MACQELEALLVAARSQSSTAGPVSLKATEKFRNNKKAAEKRIFEVVNSKIDDLIETAEYDWMLTIEPTEPSNYMQTLTRFLSNIMNSTLLGLPTEIKELIYFDALSHAANRILVTNFSISTRSIYDPGLLNMTFLGTSSFPRSSKNQSLWCCCTSKRCRVPCSICRQPR